MRERERRGELLFPCRWDEMEGRSLGAFEEHAGMPEQVNGVTGKNLSLRYTHIVRVAFTTSQRVRDAVLP
jgi:hypothetical protein